MSSRSESSNLAIVLAVITLAVVSVQAHGTIGSAASLNSGATSITAGYGSTCAVVVGGAQCWGKNDFGQLGDGTSDFQVQPTGVVGLSSGVTWLSAGAFHTCAVTDAGAAKCWGQNYWGQLGNGTLIDRLIPSDVSGLGSGVSKISAGFFHTCAITTLGGVKCWGRNSDGGLGDGTFTDRLTPTDVSGLTTNAIDVEAIWYYSCALTASGGAKCWGYNFNGQLGNGTRTRSALAVDVSSLTSGLSAITAGSNHTCALTTGGGVKCWGANQWGQLGDGTTTSRATPVDVLGLSSGVAAVSAGDSHTCALTAAGAVLCWGRNNEGQLGDATSPNKTSPVGVASTQSGSDAIATGGFHACELTSVGGVKCWGSNSNGQLGNGTTSDSPTPADVTGLTSGVSEIATGGLHSCALTTSGGVKCWGWNFWGQVGIGTVKDVSVPSDVTGLTSGVQAIALGGHHSCALLTSGGVKCWGQNFGDLGDGTTAKRLVPVDVIGLTTGAAAITAGISHTCAITTAGGAQCWGRNNYGQLGIGTSATRLTPAPVVGLDTGVAAIAGGGNHTCAVMTGGGVACWGWNLYGQLGNGTTKKALVPGAVTGLGSGVAAIATGFMHSCALLSSGSVMCWGNNSYGQVGDGTTADRMTPVQVS